LPSFRFDKISDVARNLKAFMSPEGDGTAAPDAGQSKEIESLRRELRQRREELRQISEERLAAKGQPRRSERVKRSKKKKHEIYLLEMELRAAEEGRAEGEPQTGALPDFVVIGASKCGTTFFFHLLAQHPLIEPPAFKEPHFFDLLFDEGVEWYRRCFPVPRSKDGRKTITGEATPGYIFDPHVPARMAQVVPEARLIALLRNPVERTYSAYHHRVRNGQETRTFEEAIEAGLEDPTREGPARSIYVDHLLRWSEFFPKEQMLVLKSEEFFENPKQTLKVVLDFLELPEWEPEPSLLQWKRNTGGYGQGMDPSTRRRLEEYFEPHNKRLYDYLGADFGW
jgi:Sulfotransferase domain